MDRIELENGSVIESINNIGENTRSKRGQEQVDKIINDNEIPKRRKGGSIEESARMEEYIKSQMKKDKTMKSLEYIKEKAEELEKYRNMLEKLQFVENRGMIGGAIYKFCPVCGGANINGHKRDCELAKLLRTDEENENLL